MSIDSSSAARQGVALGAPIVIFFAHGEVHDIDGTRS
jgi:hypothetical protein